MASVTSESLPAYLAEQFPDARADIDRIHSADPDTPALNVYTYMSEVVWSSGFEPAITAGDEPTIQRCFRVIEDLLASDDQNVRAAASIRVTQQLSIPKLRRLVAKHAGPNLRRDLTRPSEPKRAEVASHPGPIKGEGHRGRESGIARTIDDPLPGWLLVDELRNERHTQ